MGDILTTINYIEKIGATPVRLLIPIETKSRLQNARISAHELIVHNGRLLFNASLDKEGFELQEGTFSSIESNNEEYITNTYYKEIERFICEKKGAVEAIAYGHTVRNTQLVVNKNIRLQGAVRLVHADGTPGLKYKNSIETLLHSRKKSFTLLQCRYAIVNVWRPIIGPVMQDPLGVCDAATVEACDQVLASLEYENRNPLEYFLYTFNARHKWYYFPHMTEKEVIFIKCFDSIENGLARFTPHTSFRDPLYPNGKSPRQSIDVRVVLFFK